MTGSSTSIDDLLRHEEEPAAADPGRRRPGMVGRWLRSALVAAALAIAVLAALRMVGVALSPAAVFAGFLALLLLRQVTTGLAPVPPSPVRISRSGTGGEEDGSYNWSARDALSASMSRWENKLAWSQGESERFARSVVPQLGDLADELLRRRHGLTRATDPDRARALLGEKLWDLLETPPRRTPSPRDLAAIVAQLEKL
ncbi:hypothetical protein [Plantactinospora sonchi]|uniref:DUF4129 domain-containing protein n=1 Tax=Plantactinospora sonchi TaxID=1544735 RepID=A0ABU7RM24_9ACTN